MLDINHFIKGFSAIFAEQIGLQPWEITQDLTNIIFNKIAQLDQNYKITSGIAIHKSATLEQGVVLKAPIIIGENCFISAYSYLRGGVYLAESVRIGPSCEIKTSIIFNDTAIAHFNFIGDSIIGSQVNFEAGSLISNHFNEKIDKKISILYNSSLIATNTKKFGALVGDDSKIGANAVLSPGTILLSNSIVKRLELVEQIKQ